MTESRIRHDLAGTGSMVVDRIFRVTRLIGAEQKAQVRPRVDEPAVQERVGGVTLNHLGWARLFGLRTAIFGKLGDDREGRLLRDGMDRLGIEPHLDLSGSATSFAQVFVDEAGERAIYTARAAMGELSAEDIDVRFGAVIDGAAIVSSEVSLLPLRTVARVLERAREAGARTVLDLDVPRRDALLTLGSEAELWRVLELADVLKASRNAVEGLCIATDPADIARELQAKLKSWLVVITLGKDGAVLASESGTLHVKAAEVDVRDTTGAGDAFLGGLLAGMHLGLPVRDAALLGNACGATCCERVGAYPDDAESCRSRALELFERLGGAKLQLSPLSARRSETLDAATLAFLDFAPRELQRIATALEPATVARAADLILASERTGGRIHVTGVGKSAYVAGYASALMASTGHPATALDALEATHGSVGQLRGGDVLIAISNSGRTHELLATVEASRALGARIIAVTDSNPNPLSQAAEVTLGVRVSKEGDPLNMPPRASILAQVLALAALSLELQVRSGFDRADYHRRHPAGTLGQRSK